MITYLDEILLIFDQLVGCYAESSGFVVSHSQEAQTAELADLEALLYEPLPHIAQCPWLKNDDYKVIPTCSLCLMALM